MQERSLLMDWTENYSMNESFMVGRDLRWTRSGQRNWKSWWQIAGVQTWKSDHPLAILSRKSMPCCNTKSQAVLLPKWKRKCLIQSGDCPPWLTATRLGFKNYIVSSLRVLCSVIVIGHVNARPDLVSFNRLWSTRFGSSTSLMAC